jgi:hypothetical protein
MLGFLTADRKGRKSNKEIVNTRVSLSRVVER